MKEGKLEELRKEAKKIIERNPGIMETLHPIEKATIQSLIGHMGLDIPGRKVGARLPTTK